MSAIQSARTDCPDPSAAGNAYQARQAFARERRGQGTHKLGWMVHAPSLWYTRPQLVPQLVQCTCTVVSAASPTCIPCPSIQYAINAVNSGSPSDLPALRE